MTTHRGGTRPPSVVHWPQPCCRIRLVDRGGRCIAPSTDHMRRGRYLTRSCTRVMQLLGERVHKLPERSALSAPRHRRSAVRIITRRELRSKDCLRWDVKGTRAN
eukprot:scaffold288953_cov28-Tisochrysis_lutea.AAC.1